MFTLLLSYTNINKDQNAKAKMKLKSITVPLNQSIYYLYKLIYIFLIYIYLTYFNMK